MANNNTQTQAQVTTTEKAAKKFNWKRAAMIAGGVAATGAVAYGIYRWATSGDSSVLETAADVVMEAPEAL